ncbi:esterase/lipase family protein [Nocardia abscessus]|uniref:esterase/lipase family protein n=1 Tax=Nocardia abscessus TaxID=120957 RepID=UPI002456BD04|nr:alpha/beta fold hydrolase [Nocardia abscessus]
MLRVLSLLPAALLAFSPMPAASAEASPRVLNDWSCRPSEAHPRPVVLIHGIADDQRAWREIAPRLAARDICAFALEYGKDARTLYMLNGFAPLTQSSQEVAAFVERVRQETGAVQVDLVGHSEGGAIALALVRQLGAGAVHTAVLLAPPTYGTTLSGLVGFADGIGVRQFTDIALRELGCPACADLQPGSDFIDALGAGPVAVPGVRYEILAVADDPIVSPGGTASFVDEPGVANHLAHDIWPGLRLDHGTLPFNPVVADWVTDRLTH